MRREITLSLFSNADGKALSKYLSRDENGRLIKRATAELVKGCVERVTCSSLLDVCTLMKDLSPHKAAAFGVCSHDEALVLSRQKAKHYFGSEPMVTRTRDFFSWPEGPGVILFDYDPPPNSNCMCAEALIEALRKAVPSLHNVAFGVKPSASSCIYSENDRELCGIRGQHAFAIAENAKEIPEIGKIIVERLWLAGYGYIAITANGRMLERTIIDASVWQPERLVFGRGECETGISQRFPDINIFSRKTDDLLELDGRIELQSLFPLTDEEKVQLTQLKAQAKELKKEEANIQRKEWVNKHAHAAAKREGKDGDPESIAQHQKQFFKALDGEVLPPELVLYPQEGGEVTVVEVYKNIDKWHDKRFADPIEPDYGGDPRIAVAVLKNTPDPYIYSHAHGGMRHYLRSQEDRLAEAVAEFGNAGHNKPFLARFPIIDAKDFATRPGPEWIIDNVLPETELVMIFGQSGSGKSFFVLDMVTAVALGRKWCGRDVKQGRVVYIAAEGAGGFSRRIQAFQHYHNISWKNMGIIDGSPSFMKDSDIISLAESINSAGRVKIIVVDTLAQTTPGANENSSEDMGKAFAQCKILHQTTGATIILIHHSGKDESRGARGWSGMKGALGTEIEIKRDGDKRRAIITKQKDAEEGKEFPFRLLTVDLEGVGEKNFSSCVVEHTDNSPILKVREPKGKRKKKIYDMILQFTEFGNSPLSVEEVIQEAIKNEFNNPAKRDRRRELAWRALKDIAEEGFILMQDNMICLP